MPSGRLESAMPTKSARLTPPWRTVRPSTNDSGMPSKTDPRTIAKGAASDWAPVGSLRVAPP
jgi:hypothetical protein